jgi:hypothetical protein
MQITSAGPAVVKSVRQRQLLNAWLRLAAKCASLPEVTSYNIDRLEEEKPDMMFYDVSYENGSPRYMVTYDGQRLIEAYGVSGTGRYLEDVIGAERAAVTLPIYDQCVAHRRPSYSVRRVVDVNGRQVDYERLLLPFGSSSCVRNIVASFKTISEDGGFQQKNLMRASGAPAIHIVNAIIDQVEEAKRAHRGTALADIVEI